MIEIVSAIKGGSMMLAVFALGGVGTMLAEAAIGESTTITLGLVGGLLIGVFRAGSALQKMKDGLKVANSRLDRIEKKLKIDGADFSGGDTD